VTDSLDAWIDRQYGLAAKAMLRSISPVGTVKTRPGFGQTVTARKGAIVASPVLASYDPDPDYFFHWYRDSAVVIDALRLLFEDGSLGPVALTHLTDFVQFSLSLLDLDGRALVHTPAWRQRVAKDFEQFLRTPDDLAGVQGERIFAETRVNPDGTLDISSWPRPQNDGPAMRALALARWTRSGVAFEAGLEEVVARLLRADLAFTLRHCAEPCFDIWEEEKGRHYYTLRIQAAALDEGADWLDAQGDRGEAMACREAAQTILRELDSYWLEAQGHYRSRVLEAGTRSSKELDIAVILAAVHAGGEGAHSVFDERMDKTLAQLERLFEEIYPINRDRARGRGPAMGRYAGDVYYSGGAYYFSTLGAAEFCFRAARRSGSAARDLLRRGDGFLETVRAFTPPSGEMAEQFDQKTGEQTSAKELAWSYAAFISCVVARRAVVSP
jgi:glucoamylase